MASFRGKETFNRISLSRLWNHFLPQSRVLKGKFKNPSKVRVARGDFSFIFEKNRKY